MAILKKLSSDERVHFLINATIGVVLIITFQFVEYTEFGEDTINKAFDYVIAKEARSAAKSAIHGSPENNTKISEKLAFIDMGSVYQQRGNPLITPRDELARIIELLYKGGAKVIILDILLEEKDCCHPEHDRRLKGVFQDMVNNTISTPVIFPVRINSDGTVKKNLLEDSIMRHPHFHAAVPHISATATDRVVRYWVPYEIINSGSGSQPLWNVSFLAAMLAYGKEDELKRISEELKDQKDRKDRLIELPNGKEIEISADRDDIYLNRIRFFLIPENTISQYAGGNLFELVTKADEVAYTTFKDKIVIIGNSHPDTGDIYLTPVGMMPGMYIIGNALNTILLGLQPSHVSMILNMVIELIVIILAAYVLARYPPLIAKICRDLVLILILSLVSYYYFLTTGVLLNFAFAVVVMGVTDTATSIERFISSRKKAAKEKKV